MQKTELLDCGLAAAPSAAPQQTNRYAWIVLSDTITGDTSSSLGQVGPAGAVWKPEVMEIVTKGTPFSLLDGSGDAKFQGYLLGEFEGKEPLDDFGRTNGCRSIVLGPPEK